jgi:hypothetical protein
LLLRKHPDQIVEAMKKLQWQARSTKNLPTIIIERGDGQIVGIRVHYRGATERLPIGPRLRSLVAYLAVYRRTEHSTQALADVLEISPQSVKEYLKRLRQAFNRIRANLGTPLRGKHLFWTKRMAGGHVHGLKANIEIEDLEAFFFPEEDTDDGTPMLRCRVCQRKTSRHETTQSHIGLMCKYCCEELRGIGEV